MCVARTPEVISTLAILTFAMFKFDEIASMVSLTTMVPMIFGKRVVACEAVI